MRSFAAPQAGGGRAGVLGQLVARHPELLRPALKKPARAFAPLPTPISRFRRTSARSAFERELPYLREAGDENDPGCVKTPKTAAATQ